ncbi:hypothetical protein [Paraburkholderia heleia]|uniref:hypothetical protein n=1 Tax=Paraburkholderia heleia TaxID=634127 RepID=UPI002AB7139A|nr:hypothetical protein [Paraburkholderia heleia]
MATDKPKCDCLNDCGDDRKRIDSGEVEPCEHFKRCVAEREARAAAARASAAAVRTLEAKGYTYVDGAPQWRPPRGKPPAWVAYDTDASRDVLAERARQVNEEGFTPERDDGYADGQLAQAGAAYALAVADHTNHLVNSGAAFYTHSPDIWPWSEKWWKPTNPRRALVKAGALILAEIERLDRAAERDGESDAS